jgi:biotin operon repressor
LKVLVQESPCTLSYEELSTKAACSFKSTQRAIERLRSDGLIVVSGKRGRGNHLSFEVPSGVRTMVNVQLLYSGGGDE